MHAELPSPNRPYFPKKGISLILFDYNIRPIADDAQNILMTTKATNRTLYLYVIVFINFNFVNGMKCNEKTYIAIKFNF